MKVDQPSESFAEGISLCVAGGNDDKGGDAAILYMHNYISTAISEAGERDSQLVILQTVS
jgi:hypothetical protein